MVAGENWALIGDASGSAHPVSGGGIHYALISASLLEGWLFSWFAGKIPGKVVEYVQGRVVRGIALGADLLLAGCPEIVF